MNPLWQLTVARIREFYREPAAVFWVYGFPLLMAVALGVAFRERPLERLPVEIMSNAADAKSVETLNATLSANPRLEFPEYSGETRNNWKKRLSSGKTNLVIFVSASESGEPHYEFWDEQNRPESVLARNLVENTLLKKTAQEIASSDHHVDEAGSRYIDFLIPGLLGMNLMGGGLFGVGFVIVDMRVRKLLKRFLATPMRRSDFLLSIMASRLIFTIPEVLLLLTFGYLVFDVKNQGNILTLLFVILLGAGCFAGMGLLIACRAKTIETASGLMNLAMLPMWVLSGVFFTSEKFPSDMQWFIQILPLTALNNALRAVMLEGKGLGDLLAYILVMAAWGGISYVIALRFFRWK